MRKRVAQVTAKPISLHATQYFTTVLIRRSNGETKSRKATVLVSVKLSRCTTVRYKHFLRTYKDTCKLIMTQSWVVGLVVRG